MALKNKYQREKQQYSYDSGRTWIDVSPANYRRGRLIEAGSDDCNTVEWKEVTGSWFCIGFNETQYRWVTVSDEYVCVGYDKYEKLKKQESIDGVNWTDVVPLETMQGNLIEANSTDCGYVPPTPGDYETQYLTFEAIEDGTFTFTGRNSNSLSYSLDDGHTWTALASGSASPTVTSGNKIMWKGTCTSDATGSGKFSSTGTFNAYGNTMSIVHGDNFRNSTTISDYQFTSLFNNTKVVNAENLVLPATTLNRSCYLGMFKDCTGLTTAPELPATTLATYCYDAMFENCTNLKTAPALPATTLANNCYYYMFYGCTSLTSAPELPATRLASECYESMFKGCTSLNYIKAMFTTRPGTSYTLNWVSGVASTGTFVKNKDATWTKTGQSGIPEGWTVVTQ